AGNGRKALEALDKEAFDLILMDLQMPEMGGIEATALIREKEKSTNKRTPIVAMTAHAMTGDREGCSRAGMDGYVAKPLDPQTFFNTIEAIHATPEALLEPVILAAEPAPETRSPADSAAGRTVPAPGALRPSDKNASQLSPITLLTPPPALDRAPANPAVATKPNSKFKLDRQAIL